MAGASTRTYVRVVIVERSISHVQSCSKGSEYGSANAEAGERAALASSIARATAIARFMVVA
jgi:hypothetical protein